MLVLWHEDTLLHHPPVGYPETPDRVGHLVAGLAELGHAVEQPSLELERTRALAQVVHSPRYVARFEAAARRGDGLLDSADNPLMPQTFRAALAAAAVTVAAVERAVGAADSPVEAVFAAVRPPGHHCEREVAMGFCYLANVAIGVAAARARGLQRPAIFDFDVHHGNGTQHLFETDPAVLFVSTHQSPFYPGTGAASERGEGAGAGATVNVPLPAGTTPAAFLAAVDHEVMPALRRHRPDLLLISVGLDAWRGDPLGGFRLETDTFGEIGSRLRLLAQECGAPVVAVLEGGYAVESLPELVDAFLTGLAGTVR